VTTPPLSRNSSLPSAITRGGIDLSIVIPAFNEETRILPTLEAVGDYLARAGLRAEVLVVDDGSTDSTAARVSERLRALPGLRLLRNGRNRGKGFSIRHGVSESRGRLVLLTDADLSTPIQEIRSLWPAVTEHGYGIAIGSRALDPSRVEVPQGWIRRKLGNCFNLLVRAVTGLPLRDTQCGFKLLIREVFLPIFNVACVDRFAYDVEILYLAHRRGIRIAEIPVIWRNSPQTRVRVLLDPFLMLADLARIALRQGTGGYRETL